MKQEKHNISSREIRSFYYSTIRDLKRTVSMSKKGKPHKQAWGTSIINPMRSHK